jgi:predicted O-methyltransferase YrrM
MDPLPLAQSRESSLAVVASALDNARRSPTAARARMAVFAMRLAASRARVDRAVARALTTTAFDRIPGEEREWIERIESRRRDLISQHVVTQPIFDPGTPGPKGDLQVMYEPVSLHLASQLMSLPRMWCILLMRLIRELVPQACLELGTAFGISGAYLAAALESNAAGRLTTMEGAREWAAIAERGFEDLGLSRVETVVGPISETFDKAAAGGPFDYVFVDAEHSEEAIQEYFRTILPHLAPSAVIVFDDIDFSEGMWRAWRVVASHERVSRAMGLGRMGIAVLGPGSREVR